MSPSTYPILTERDPLNLPAPCSFQGAHGRGSAGGAGLASPPSKPSLPLPARAAGTTLSPTDRPAGAASNTTDQLLSALRREQQAQDAPRGRERGSRSPSPAGLVRGYAWFEVREGKAMGGLRGPEGFRAQCINQPVAQSSVLHCRASARMSSALRSAPASTTHELPTTRHGL